MAQLMPLPLTVSCFSKIQIGITFLLPAYPGSPGQRAVKQVCVCVCVCARVQMGLKSEHIRIKHFSCSAHHWLLKSAEPRADVSSYREREHWSVEGDDATRRCYATLVCDESNAGPEVLVEHETATR